MGGGKRQDGGSYRPPVAPEVGHPGGVRPAARQEARPAGRADGLLHEGVLEEEGRGGQLIQGWGGHGRRGEVDGVGGGVAAQVRPHVIRYLDEGEVQKEKKIGLDQKKTSKYIEVCP